MQVSAERANARLDRSVAEGGPRPLQLTIRRGSELEDAWRHVGGSAPLKGPLAVSFVNAQGMPEAGLDHGGLTKEFLTEGVRCAIDPQLGLFDTTADGLLFARPAAERLDQVGERNCSALCERINKKPVKKPGNNNHRPREGWDDLRPDSEML